MPNLRSSDTPLLSGCSSEVKTQEGQMSDICRTYGYLYFSLNRFSKTNIPTFIMRCWPRNVRHVSDLCPGTYVGHMYILLGFSPQAYSLDPSPQKNTPAHLKVLWVIFLFYGDF